MQTKGDVMGTDVFVLEELSDTEEEGGSLLGSKGLAHIEQIDNLGE